MTACLFSRRHLMAAAACVVAASTLTLATSPSSASSPGLELSLTQIIVPEGSTSAYTVRLATRPSADVVVTVTVSGDSDITVNDTDPDTGGTQNTLTFTTDNWAIPQTVTLTAEEETGNTDIAYGEATVTHTASYSTATLTAREGDNDVCPGTTAVGGSGVTTGGLVDDCNTLLAAKEILKGSATTNWSTDTDIDDWDGITTGMEPRRVTKIDSLSFSGVIPNTLGNLTGLTHLVMGYGLSGPIPAQLGNLTNLKELFLWGPSLHGAVPPEIGNLTGLTELVLGSKLTSIPAEIGQLKSLKKRLWLAGNELTSIPKEIGQLTNLKELYLHGNKLTSIPWQIGGLTNLETLDLERNSLTSIPKEIGDLKSLTHLDLKYNSLTLLPPDGSDSQEPRPDGIGGLTNLKELELNFNKLESIPKEIGKLTSLETLWLSNNSLTSLPDEIGDLKSLTHLYLENNSLTGSIPAALGNLTNLKRLDLFQNKLSGPIPKQLGNLTNLTHLDLYNNSLKGSIPTEFGNLTNLNNLYAQNNSLSGPIPPALGNLTNLTNVNFNNNSLSGPIPPALGNLTSLEQLNLEQNSLTGCVPPNLIHRLEQINPQTNSVNLVVCDGVVVSDANPVITEGSTKEIMVRLSTAPSGNVTVSIVRTGDTDITADMQSLSYSTSNWSDEQTVTLSARDDSDIADGVATFTLSASSGDSNYNSASARARIVATEADDDYRLVVDDVTSYGATLRIENHTGDWSLHQTAPTEGDCIEKDSGTDFHEVDGLSPGTAYTYTAHRDRTCNPEPQSVSFTTPAIEVTRPGEPVRPTLSAGVGTLTATWNPPSFNGGSQILDYDVQYCWWTWADVDYCKNVANWQDWPHYGTATQTTITGLDSANNYRVKVRAKNSVGPGPWSPVAYGKPNSTTPGAPAPPAVTAHRSQHGVWLTVDWDRPEWSGTRIWYWQVRWKPDGGSWQHKTLEATGFTDTSILDVAPETTYRVQVRATIGPWSKSGSATTASTGTTSKAQAQGTQDNQKDTQPSSDAKPIYNCGKEGDDGWYSDGVFVDHSHAGTGCIVDWYWRSDHTHELLSGTNKPHSHEH